MKPQLVKQRAAPAVVARTAERDAIADEYGPLAVELQLLEARVRALRDENSRYTLLKAKIREWYAGKPEAERFLYESDRYQLEITARENEAAPAMQELFDLFGLKRFLALCSFTRKAAAAELARLRKPEALLEKLFPKARTGDRSVKAIAKPEVKAA